MNFKRFNPIILGAIIGYFAGMLLLNCIIWVDEAQVGDHPVFIGGTISLDNIARNWKANQIKKADPPTQVDREEALNDAYRKAISLAIYAQGGKQDRPVSYMIGEALKALQKAKDIGCAMEMSVLESRLPEVAIRAAERNANLELENFQLFIAARFLNQGTVGKNAANVQKAITLIRQVGGNADPFEKRFRAMLPKGIDMNSVPVRYEVKPGDYLSSICLEIYGDGSRERWEAEAKRLGIENPHLIKPGQVFIMFKPALYRYFPKHEGYYHWIRPPLYFIK